MKKLLYYSDCFIFGGSEKLLLNLVASSCINEAFEVHYAYARNTDYQKGVDREVPEAVRRYPISILDNCNLFYRIDRSALNRFLAFCLKVPFALLERTGLYACYNLLRLLFFMREMRPDLLHINNGGYPAARSCLVAVVAARLAGIPRVVFTVNNLPQKQRNLVEKLVDRYICARVDRFVSASSLAGRMLVQNRQFAPDRVMQIYNGIPADRPARGRAEVLREFGISPERFILTTVALLTERKGQMTLLDAFRSLRISSPDLFRDAVVILVGDGEDRAAVERYLGNHGMTDCVVLAGQRADFLDFIAASDLFVLPSLRDEDMPLVILSAMSCGTPIVSTRVAGIMEQVRDGVDGILVDPGDPEALAGAITRFYRDRSFGASCGARARDRFAERFSLDRLTQKYLALYRELDGE